MATGHGKAILDCPFSSPLAIRLAAASADMRNGMGKGLRAVIADSTKPGQMTWTPIPYFSSGLTNPSP